MLGCAAAGAGADDAAGAGATGAVIACAETRFARARPT
jgi:hypothetical protein